MSSNIYGVGDILERERLELSVGRYNKKKNQGSGTYVGRNAAGSSLVPMLSITLGRNLEPGIKRSRMRQILHTFRVNLNL